MCLLTLTVTSKISSPFSVLMLVSLPEKEIAVCTVHRALWATVIQLFTMLNIEINNHDEK